MPILLLATLVFSASLPDLLPKEIAVLSHSMHQFCKNLLNTSQLGKPINQALFCGSSIRNSHWQDGISQLGLIHLLVISGLHLNFISKLVHFFLKNSPKLCFAVTNVMFIFLCGVTNLQAPCIRAFFYFLSTSASKNFHLNWSRSYCHFLSVSTCLLFFPIFWKSHSLIISWLVTLVVSEFRHRKILAATLIYLVLLPWQLSLFHSSPLSIVINAFLAGPLVIVFFLFSIFDVFTMILNLQIIESHWVLVKEIIRWMGLVSPSIGSSLSLPSTTYLWCYTLGLQIFFLLKRQFTFGVEKTSEALK